ncbi:MAG: hypothetical protein AAB525_03980, partial [Patescibacteria group bacterium]
MQYSVVNYKTVKKESRSFRIDADFFRADYLSIQKKLQNKPYKKLSDYSVKIKHPTEIKREYHRDGVLFLRAQNVRPLQIDIENNPVYISDHDAKLLKNNLIETKDILLTRTGANFGQCAIYLDNQKAIASSHTFIIKSSEINPFFLAVFLNTNFGRKLIDKGMYGGLQPEVAPFFLYQIPLPIFKIIPNLIEKIYLLSQDYIATSQNLYSQAEQLLLSELGLMNWKPKHELVFIKNFSDTQKAERFDAEYFQPKYEENVEAVKKYKSGFDELGNLIKIKKSIEPGSEAYQENGVPFVRVSNLSKFELSTNNQQFISEELYEELKSHQPKKGEILLSKDATPGIAYFLNEEPQKMIVSGGILRLKMDSKQILPEYLTLVLNSVIVKKQIERDVGGSIINHWRPDQVKATLVPVLKEDKQKEIKELIEKSFNDRKLSKSLLEIANRGVETAIEKNENEAEKWITSELEKLE